MRNVLLSGIVGSTAYGLAHEGSDVDRLGVFAVPTADLHGLGGHAESHVTTNPDKTLHEAAKWCRLALRCNPTVLELVWLPMELYEVTTPLGLELIKLRLSLLSAKAVRNAYLGYATQQFRKLQAREVIGTSAYSREQSEKHARHLVRLLEQGTKLHRHGELVIRLDDPERVRELGKRIAGSPHRGEVALRQAEIIFDGPSVLPGEPDTAAVEAWLRRVRREHYDVTV